MGEEQAINRSILQAGQARRCPPGSRSSKKVPEQTRSRGRLGLLLFIVLEFSAYTNTAATKPINSASQLPVFPTAAAGTQHASNSAAGQVGLWVYRLETRSMYRICTTKLSGTATPPPLPRAPQCCEHRLGTTRATPHVLICTHSFYACSLQLVFTRLMTRHTLQTAACCSVQPRRCCGPGCSLHGS
jgi:hypothetical protein